MAKPLPNKVCDVIRYFSSAIKKPQMAKLMPKIMLKVIRIAGLIKECSMEYLIQKATPKNNIKPPIQENNLAAVNSKAGPWLSSGTVGVKVFVS